MIRALATQLYLHMLQYSESSACVCHAHALLAFSLNECALWDTSAIDFVADLLAARLQPNRSLRILFEHVWTCMHACMLYIHVIHTCYT
jgi:hypothetical protein